jgi:hypothetical protein
MTVPTRSCTPRGGAFSLAIFGLIILARLIHAAVMAARVARAAMTVARIARLAMAVSRVVRAAKAVKNAATVARVARAARGAGRFGKRVGKRIGKRAKRSGRKKKTRDHDFDMPELDDDTLQELAQEAERPKSAWDANRKEAARVGKLLAKLRAEGKMSIPGVVGYNIEEAERGLAKWKKGRKPPKPRPRTANELASARVGIMRAGMPSRTFAQTYQAMVKDIDMEKFEWQQKRWKATRRAGGGPVTMRRLPRKQSNPKKVKRSKPVKMVSFDWGRHGASGTLPSLDVLRRRLAAVR